jgi:hypothetical protein
MSDGKRGPKPLGVRDWLFGSAPRHRLLRVVVGDVTPTAGWTKADLARAAGVTTKGGVDGHVAGLAAVGLLRHQSDGRWYPGASRRLASALRRVLAELDEVSA